MLQQPAKVLPTTFNCMQMHDSHSCFVLLQTNTFQSQAGKYTCDNCPAGSEAPGTANIACSKCGTGWYNPTAGELCAPASCALLLFLMGS